MISTALAAALRDAGLRWAPISGDAFQIDGPDFEGDVFTVSDMTIEAHHHVTGTVLGFNGTTEWALDSVSIDDALWMPREHQLRDRMGSAFRSLDREVVDGRAVYRVRVALDGREHVVEDEDAEEAYGTALLALLRSISG
ncbi:pilus assembly protein CpaE [Microbacterium tumbae]